jgi:hypothetical protein
VQFVGMPGRGEAEEHQRFIDDFGLNGIPHVADPDGSLWRRFGISSQPAWVLINDDGTTEVIPTGLGHDQIQASVADLIAS